MAGLSFFQIRSPHKLLYTVLVVVLASENIYLGTDNIYISGKQNVTQSLCLGPYGLV